jgi:hypothetical protein
MSDKSTGKAKGGFARAKKLTARERSEIARQAALKRWGDNFPKAEYSGDLNKLSEGLRAFVLEDGRRVISGRGITKAVGMKGRGQGTARIASLLRRKGNQFNELALAIEDPLLIDSGAPLPTQGYEAALLVDLCHAILDLRESGLLKTEQEHRYAQACYALTKAFAKTGIVALVDEATGYQEVRPKDALQLYLEKVIRKELAAWAKKFPDEFYENIYKLKNWTWPGMKKNRYSVVAYYTRDLVYERIAPGLLHELEKKTPTNDSGYRPNKLHQWLTDDIGNPMLAQHLHSIIMFQRLAIRSGFGWNRFVKMVDQVMPKRGNTLELPFPDPGEDDRV